MVTRRLLKGSAGQDYGWFLYGDSGDTGSSVALSKNAARMVVNDSHVCMVLAATLGQFGVTKDAYLITDFDLDGNLNYEKILGDDTDTYDLVRDNNSFSNPFNHNFLQINPQDTDYVLVAAHHEEANEAVIFNISDTGAIIHAVNPDLNGTLNEAPNILVLSNGDVWVNADDDPDDLECLDRSAGSPYQSDIQTCTGTFISYANGSCVDSSDNIILAGSYSGAPASIRKINTSGTVTYSKEWYVINDAGDFNRCYYAIADSSDNVYVAWQQYDSSTTTYTELLTKFNSTLTEQWTVQIDNAPSQWQERLALSPDENNLYWMQCFTVGSATAYMAVIDVSDGSFVNSWNLSYAGTGSEDFYAHSITSNSTDVFVGGVWRDSSGNQAGPAIIKLTQAAFEAGTTLGEVTCTTGTITGTTDKTPTVNNGPTSASTYTATQSDMSSKVVSSALDSAITYTVDDL